MGIHNVNWDATRELRDPDSRIFLDGRQHLVGEDWKARKREIWDRGQGICERVTDDVRCRQDMHDPHHIVKRSKLRDDRPENLIGLCRDHHDMEDNRKIGGRR